MQEIAQSHDQTVDTRTILDEPIAVIRSTDIVMPRHISTLWVEIVVHAQATMQKITGNPHAMPDEYARIEKDGSATLMVIFPSNQVVCSIRIPMGQWKFRKLN
jgi:hypothetical protein